MIELISKILKVFAGNNLFEEVKKYKGSFRIRRKQNIVITYTNTRRYCPVQIRYSFLYGKIWEI